MSNAYFAFRQFGIRQDRCAMKVSTDACIFGAWIPVPPGAGSRILDIGAGTGLLSLMLAQRQDTVLIDAVELEPAAAMQAAENCADSIFAGRIRIVNADARSFRSQEPYDLIVSNPPFFINSLKGPDAARNAARHAGSLDLRSLFGIAARLLGENGAFALLMPLDLERSILDTASGQEFHCVRRLIIRDNPAASPKRGCWLFRRHVSSPVAEDSITIRAEGSYTEEFRDLLCSYYLLL